MILLLLIGVITAQNLSQFPIYGRYCGINHYDIYGRSGICELDDACQIHDICTSRGLSDCFCNQQLFWYASNILPINFEASYAKRSILRYIYYSIAPCSDYYYYDKFRVLGNMNNKGFNYLPIYHSGNYKINVKHDAKLYVIFLTHSNYMNFTVSVYNNPNSYRNFNPKKWEPFVNIKEVAVIYSAEPIEYLIISVAPTSFTDSKHNLYSIILFTPILASLTLIFCTLLLYIQIIILRWIMTKICYYMNSSR